MTKLQIIDETVEFYSVPGRRSLNADPYSSLKCLYNGPEGRHCAFARVAENPEDFEEGQRASALISHGDVRFKPGYEGHSQDFWNSIQNLHDNDYIWASGGGLTEEGEKKVRDLKNEYARCNEPSVN